MRRCCEVRRPSFPRCWPTWIFRPRCHLRGLYRDRRHKPRLVTGPPGGTTGPRWDGGPAWGLIKLEVSSLGGSRLCRHQWCTQTSLNSREGGRFYRPAEPSDLKKFIEMKWTEARSRGRENSDRVPGLPITRDSLGNKLGSRTKPNWTPSVRIINDAWLTLGP